jgi:putative phosphoribosyl transferase
MEEREVRISAGPVELEGILDIPEGAQGIVLFAHGSGSGRHSPRNRYVAGALREAGLATLLIDLLTPEEEEVDLRTRRLRFDIGSATSALARGQGPRWSRQNARMRWARSSRAADARIWRGRRCPVW